MSKGSLIHLRHFLAAALALTASDAAASVDAGAPNGLRCLERHYAVKAALVDGGWVGVLPDGGLLPWDDGRQKNAEQRLESPDLEDMFAEAYSPGPIAEPVSDAGRVRVGALFRATFGATKEQVDVVPFVFFGQQLHVHRKALPAFERVRARLEQLVAATPRYREFLEGAGGTFQWRNIAGTTRLSAHSHGVSLDLNVKKSHYWRWDKTPKFRNLIPEDIVRAFEAEGFIWGGRWVHYDTMHFELRPELLDGSCYG